jgi:hypothetical protein
VTSLLPLIGRGALAGALAGAISGAVSFALAEPSIDRAVALEAARDEAAGEHAMEVFTRPTQHIGLVVAAVVTGLAIGVIFAVVYAWLHRRDPDHGSWYRSLGLAGAGFVAVTLLPFLRYPANPPGTGDPSTLDARTRAWLLAIIIGLATLAAAVQAYTWLTRRGVGVPARQLAAVGVVVAGLAVLWLLPDNHDPVDVPANLMWTFRLWSLAASAMLWGGLGIGFGLAGERAARRVQAGVLATTNA